MPEGSFRDTMEFMAPLLEQSARDLAFTTNSLIDSLAMECAESAARIQLIGEAIDDLFSGPYAPSERAIMEALYPRESALRERTQEILISRGIHSSTHHREA